APRDGRSALTEDDVHHQAGRRDETPEAIRARVAEVLGERIGGQREIRQDGKQPLGDRLPALVAEELAETKILEEVAVPPLDGCHPSSSPGSQVGLWLRTWRGQHLGHT